MQVLLIEKEELLRKLRESERKLGERGVEAEHWAGEAHELKKALAAAQTQAVTYAESLQVQMSSPICPQLLRLPMLR